MSGWVLARLKERSTWLGVVSALTAAGLGLAPEQREAVVAAGLAIAGLVAALWPDVKAPPNA